MSIPCGVWSILSDIRAGQTFAERISWPLGLTTWLALVKGIFVDVIRAKSGRVLANWVWPFGVIVIAVRICWCSLMEDEWEKGQIESGQLPQRRAAEIRGQPANPAQVSNHCQNQQSHLGKTSWHQTLEQKMPAAGCPEDLKFSVTQHYYGNR